MLELAFIYDGLQRFAEAEWMYYEARGFDPKSIAAQQYYEAHLARWKAGDSYDNKDTTSRYPAADQIDDSK